MKAKLIIAVAVIITVITAMDFGIANAEETEYVYTEYPLERNGLALHLDCVQVPDRSPSGNILLVHRSSYSSHEFDIDYQDYSLVRRLAMEGYAIWRIDIAGYGQSDPVADGFLPDTGYAAEDINAAVEEIVRVSGQDKIDVLGWSWGTMTAGLYAVRHPEHLGKLILYAPIVSGLGQRTLGDAFSHNTWAGAAEDFQTKEDGSFNLDITDPILIEIFCSSCWHYDGDSSPNGWSKDAFVAPDTRLIDLDRIAAPTLLIYGNKDPNLNYSILDIAAESLPEGSEVQIFPGGSHILMYEKKLLQGFPEQDSFIPGEIEMKYKHTNRPGFLLGFIDFFTAGLFFLFYMPRGLEDELESVLGHKVMPYWKAYLLGIPTLFIYPLIWMGRIADELKNIAEDLGLSGPYTSFRHMFDWNVFGLILMGPAVATERFFKTLNQIEKKLNRQEYEKKFLTAK